MPGFTALCSSLSSLNSRRKKEREREVARCSAGGSVLRVRNEPHACSVDRHVPMQRRWWLPGSHQSSPRLAPTSASHGPLTGPTSPWVPFWHNNGLLFFFFFWSVKIGVRLRLWSVLFSSFQVLAGCAIDWFLELQAYSSPCVTSSSGGAEENLNPG